MGLFIVREDVKAKLYAHFPNEDYLSLPMTFDERFIIGNHPDIHASILNTHVIVSPQLYDFLLSLPRGQIYIKQYSIIKGHLNPSPVYPGDVLYNVFCHDKHVFSKKVDQTIEAFMETHTFEKVGVKQGYVKCNTFCINDECVITEDENLNKIYSQYFSNPILIQKGYIKLSGYDYGFIGGATGKRNQTLIFNGALSYHPQGDRIKSLMNDYHLSYIELSQTPLEDCGSILYVK